MIGQCLSLVRSSIFDALFVLMAVMSSAGCGSDEPGSVMGPSMGEAGTSGLPGAAGSLGAAGTSGTGSLPVGVAGSAGVASGVAGAAGARPTAGAGGGAAGSTAGASGGAAGGAGAAPAAGSGGTAAGGSGGSAGAAGASGASGAGGDPMMHEDLGMGDGSDVITIGDSWMNLLLSGIEQSLERISMRNYRNYAVPGTLVLNEQIPDMYTAAKAADPDIKTVVMTGGGNDILSSPCTGTACEPIVDDVSERLSELMLEMGMDGVEDVVLIGYTYPADEGKHASLDYSIMKSTMSCIKTAMPRCHFIDSSKLMLTLADGIHPNGAGYDLLGKTVWELMQAEGIRR